MLHVVKSGGLLNDSYVMPIDDDWVGLWGPLGGRDNGDLCRGDAT